MPSKLQGPAGVPVGEVKFNELQQDGAKAAGATMIKVTYVDGDDAAYSNVVHHAINGEILLIKTAVTLDGRWTQSAFDPSPARQMVRTCTVRIKISEIRSWTLIEEA